MDSKIEIKKEEVLRYLGYKGQEIDCNLDLKIESLILESKNLFRERVAFREFYILKEDGEIKLKDTNIKLKGKDIYNLLKDSDRCILIAVTLGNDIEKKIRLYSKTDLTSSVILDACATAGVESLCDNLEENLKEEFLNENENFTFRYSPGYGDLSLSIQKDFIEILDCKRRLGLNLSEHLILFPRKSVTAILGITKEKLKVKRNCKNCNNYDRCIYRKEDGEFGCNKST